MAHVLAIVLAALAPSNSAAADSEALILKGEIVPVEIETIMAYIDSEVPHLSSSDELIWIQTWQHEDGTDYTWLFVYPAVKKPGGRQVTAVLCVSKGQVIDACETHPYPWLWFRDRLRDRSRFSTPIRGPVDPPRDRRRLEDYLNRNEMDG